MLQAAEVFSAAANHGWSPNDGVVVRPSAQQQTSGRFRPCRHPPRRMMDMMQDNCAVRFEAVTGSILGNINSYRGYEQFHARLAVIVHHPKKKESVDWRKVPHRKFAFRSQSARAATLIQLAREKKGDRLQPGSQSITRCERLRSCSRGGARYRRYRISYAPATRVSVLARRGAAVCPRFVYTR